MRRWVAEHANNIARITIVTAFLLLAVWAITLEDNNLVIGYSSFARWCTTALVNVGPELAGIVIGVVTIDYLNERRQEEQLKKQLILQLGSSHNDVTDTALRALKAYGWLYDGTLIEAYLWGANLKNANLAGANLKSTNLLKANLENADLEKADLKNANLAGANLENANVERANLKNANLARANLKSTNLFEANLENARVWRANLENAYVERANLENASLLKANLENATCWKEEQLRQAGSLEGAIMPDGTKLKDSGHRPIPFSSEKPYDGPTFEEWLAMRQNRVDEQALAELEALLTAERNFEEE